MAHGWTWVPSLLPCPWPLWMVSPSRPRGLVPGWAPLTSKCKMPEQLRAAHRPAVSPAYLINGLWEMGGFEGSSGGTWRCEAAWEPGEGLKELESR